MLWLVEFGLCLGWGWGCQVNWSKHWRQFPFQPTLLLCYSKMNSTWKTSDLEYLFHLFIILTTLSCCLPDVGQQGRCRQCRVFSWSSVEPSEKVLHMTQELQKSSLVVGTPVVSSMNKCLILKMICALQCRAVLLYAWNCVRANPYSTPPHNTPTEHPCSVPP